MNVDKSALAKAKDLIKNNQYVKESDWSEAQPSTDRENEYLEDHDWKAYSEWHLGMHEDENKGTKGRFGFPYGDFRRLHRSGLIAAKQRAAQNDYTEVEQAADELLEMLDEKIVKGPG